MSESFPTPGTETIRVPEWFIPYNPRFSESDLETQSYRRKLPHWRYEGATYFVTFRLHDSIPHTAVEALRREAEAWEKRVTSERAVLGGQLSATTRRAYEDFQRAQFQNLENHLDESHGCCLMREAGHRAIVHEALLHFENTRCRMAAFVIMPNHIHALCQPLPEHPIENLAGSWKKHTADKINACQARKGRLWQPETHDRIIRDGDHFRRALRYLVRNPQKARLGKDDAEVWLSDELRPVRSVDS